MRNSFKNLIFILLLFLVISAVFSLFSKPFENEKELSLTQLVQDINQEKIKQITVTGNNLEVVYRDESKAKLVKETGSDLGQILLNYGVEKEKLNKVSVGIKQETSTWTWLGPILFTVFPIVIFGFFFWMIFRQAKTGAMQAFAFTKARAKLFGADGNTKEKITFDEVGGLKEAKEELKEIIDFLKNPKKYLQ